MKNKYCPNCGNKLKDKFVQDEGLIPYCDKCDKLYFEIYSVAVSMIIIAKNTKRVLLVKQYNKEFYRFVAGYINKGEGAEDAIYREMNEEISKKPIFIKPLKTGFFEPSETLMLNYLAIIEDEDIKPNYEIDTYDFFEIDEALTKLKSTSLAKIFYEYFLENCGDEIDV